MNFLFQASYQLLLILVPLVTTPYLSRVLGAQAVGAFSYTQAVSSYFAMFAMLGISTYGVREIAACGGDRAMRSLTFWGAYASQFIVALVACGAYVMYLALAGSPGGIVVGAVWGMNVLAALFDASWLLFGVEEFKIPTIRSFITKLATLPVIFLFVKTPDDLWVYCAAIAGSALANQLLIWPFVSRYVDWARPCWREVRRHFKPSFVLFVPVIAISLYTQMDKILLGHLAGMQQAGFFEYSEKLSKMPMAVITAMGTVMLPRMTAELAAGKRESALSLLVDSVWAMLAMASALMFGIMAIAPEFAPVFLGEEFAECDSIMRMLSLVIPIISMTNIIGRQYLVPTGRDRNYTASVCVGAVVNVAVNLALIPKLGAMGAAVATVAAELAVLLSQVLSARGELPFGVYVRSALPFLVIGAIMFAAVRLVATRLVGSFGLGATALALEVVIGIAVFAALSGIWCVATRDTRFLRIIVRGKESERRGS